MERVPAPLGDPRKGLRPAQESRCSRATSPEALLWQVPHRPAPRKNSPFSGNQRVAGASLLRHGCVSVLAGSSPVRHPRLQGPVAQWIERQPSKLRAEVRLLPGPLRPHRRTVDEGARSEAGALEQCADARACVACLEISVSGERGVSEGVAHVTSLSRETPVFDLWGIIRRRSSSTTPSLFSRKGLGPLRAFVSREARTPSTERPRPPGRPPRPIPLIRAGALPQRTRPNPGLRLAGGSHAFD